MRINDLHMIPCFVRHQGRNCSQFFNVLKHRLWVFMSSFFPLCSYKPIIFVSSKTPSYQHCSKVSGQPLLGDSKAANERGSDTTGDCSRRETSSTAAPVFLLTMAIFMLLNKSFSRIILGLCKGLGHEQL